MLAEEEREHLIGLGDRRRDEFARDLVVTPDAGAAEGGLVSFGHQVALDHGLVGDMALEIPEEAVEQEDGDRVCAEVPFRQAEANWLAAAGPPSGKKSKKSMTTTIRCGHDETLDDVGLGVCRR